MTRDEWKTHRRTERVRIRRTPKAPAFDPRLLKTITRGALGLV